MSEHDPEKEGRLERTVPGYIALREDGELRNRELARKWAGGILSTGAVLGLVFVFIISNIEVQATNYAATAVWSLIAVGIIGGFGAMFWIADRSKGFLIGAMIGVGVGLLIEGTCFTMLILKR